MKITKKLVIAIILIITCFSYGASDIIISQYIETDSGTTPKGIEVWNVSDSSIDFSSKNLVVKKV